VKAAHIADLMFNRSFLDPVLRGEYPADLVALLKHTISCLPVSRKTAP
jgi:6-phospho-beta-glucosidase